MSKTKEFIIVGDNNFLYDKVHSRTLATKAVEKIKKNLKIYGCGNYDEKRKPHTISIYEIINVYNEDVSHIEKLK